MRSVMLYAGEDERHGNPGLFINGMSSHDDMLLANGSGIGVAHDLFEHVNGVWMIGDTDDELEALGAMWYIRGRHGQLMPHSRSVYTPHESIGSEIVEVYRDMLNGNMVSLFRDPPKRTRVHGLYEEDLIDIVRYADKHFDSEYSDYFESEEEFINSGWTQFKVHALRQMRVGLRKAHQRWRRADAWGQFFAVADAVEPFARMASSHVGQQFVLTYGDGKARCVEQFEEGYE